MIRAAKRDAVEASIVEALRAAGCYVWRLDRPVDLLIGYRGRTYLAEIKSSKTAKLTPSQVRFFDEWRGGPLHVVRSVEDALAVLGGN